MVKQKDRFFNDNSGIDIYGIPLNRIPQVSTTKSMRAAAYDKSDSLPKFSHLSGITVSPDQVKALKIQAARRVMNFFKPNMIVGIGTGTTINELIPLITRVIGDIDGIASSSTETTTALKRFGIEPLPVSAINRIHLYIDGADQINPSFEMIKGGGGALTGEKIISGMADDFIAIADTTKIVQEFSSPIPLEIIPLALPLVTKKIKEMGGNCYLRENYKTEYGNFIIDIRGLDSSHPPTLEEKLNNIEGVVTNGLFTGQHRANKLLIASPDGVLEYNRISEVDPLDGDTYSFKEEDLDF